MRARFPFHLVLAVGVTVAAACMLAWWAGTGRHDSEWLPSERAVIAPQHRGAQRDSRADAVGRLARAVPDARVGAERPASLQGTEVDGGLAVDERGVLIIGPDLRRFFDYFLSAAGEEPAAQTRARLQAEIAAQLSGAAAVRAQEMLERYIAYRERVRDVASAPGQSGELGQRLELLRQVRRDVFGEADTDALFGDEEAEVFVALAQKDTATNADLSPAERQDRLAALDEQLPDSARAARAAATGPLRLAREEAALQAAGADAAEIRALREQHVGPEAAARLEALDRQRLEWQGRVDEFRRARTAIEADSMRSAEEQARAVKALLSASFTPTEQLRLRALDRIAAERTGQSPVQ